MIPKNLYSQFLSMNKDELYWSITAFNELNDVADMQMSLYLDMNGWELLDLRFGKVVMSFPYKHLKDLRECMTILKHTFIHVGSARHGLRSSLSHLTTNYKRLQKWYSEYEIEILYPGITEILWKQQRKRN